MYYLHYLTGKMGSTWSQVDIIGINLMPSWLSLISTFRSGKWNVLSKLTRKTIGKIVYHKYYYLCNTYIKYDVVFLTYLITDKNVNKCSNIYWNKINKFIMQYHVKAISILCTSYKKCSCGMVFLCLYMVVFNQPYNW
jgi:hypothetical protein